MPPQIDSSEQEPFFIFEREEADRLITEALDTSRDEPEPFIRLFLILFDNAQEPRMKDAVYLLMKVAYEGSVVHSIDFQEYLETIRQGQNPVEAARTRWYGSQKSEG